MAKLSEILPYIVSGGVGQAQQQLQAKRDQEMKLRQIIATAMAQEQAKAAFPSPEDQAKSQVIQMANQAGQMPQPMGGYNPQEQAAGIPGQVTGAAQQRKLDILKYILPKMGGDTGISMTVNAAGQAEPLRTPEGKTVSAKNKVITTPTGQEQMTQQAAWKSEGSTAGKLAATQKHLAGRFSNGLSVIQQNLDDLNQTVSATMKTHPAGVTTEAHLRKQLGTYDPTFRRAQSTIDAQLGLFAQAVEGVPGGRAAQGIMQKMSNLMKDMPFLPETEQRKNMQTLQQLIRQVTDIVGSASTSSSQQVGRFTIEPE